MMQINLFRVQNYNHENFLSRFLELFFMEIYGRNPCNYMIDSYLRYVDFST